MRSTTIRFADPVYEQLERASEATGLPINSIVVVACLEWLRDNPPGLGRLVHPPPSRLGWRRLMQGQETVRLESRPPPRRRALVVTGSDPLDLFTGTAQEALGLAQEEAERSQSWIGTEQLLHGLYEAPQGRAGKVLRLLGADVGSLRSGPEDAEPAEQPAGLLPTAQLRQVLRLAKDEMRREEASQVGTDHLLLGLLLDRDSRVAEALEAAGVTYRAARDALASIEAEP